MNIKCFALSLVNMRMAKDNDHVTVSPVPPAPTFRINIDHRTIKELSFYFYKTTNAAKTKKLPTCGS